MEHSYPRWQAVIGEDEGVISSETDEDLLSALREREIEEAVVGAVEYAQRRARPVVPPAYPNRAIDQATNTMIDLPPGCFDFPPGARIVAVELVSVVLLSKFRCGVAAFPKLFLCPTAVGTQTLRQLPEDWSGAVMSARSWY